MRMPPMAFTLALCIPLLHAAARAEFGEPATLIIESHTKNDAGDFDPNHTPDAAIRAAIGWARVRHRVTLLTPRGCLEHMNAKMDAEVRKLPPGIRKPSVCPYDGPADIPGVIGDWEKRFFISGIVPRACFGVVHVLGHGYIVDKHQLLQLPYERVGNETLDNERRSAATLDIDHLCTGWQLRCQPVCLFLDICGTDTKGELPAPAGLALPRRKSVDPKDGVVAFVDAARSLQNPLDGTVTWYTTRAGTAIAGESAADCPDLFGNRIADGLAIAGIEPDAWFVAFAGRVQTRTVKQLFEFAQERMRRREGAGHQVQQNDSQIRYGILRADHVIATSTKTIPYRAPRISGLVQFARIAECSNAHGVLQSDEHTGRVVITRKGDGVFYVCAREKVAFPLTTLCAERKCAIRVAAKPGVQGAAGTIRFGVEFSKGEPFTRRKTFSVAIGEEAVISIENLLPSDQLAFATLPIYEGALGETWPTGAELHLSSIEFLDPHDEVGAGRAPEIEGTADNALGHWSAKDVLGSAPACEISRTSPGFRRQVEFAFDHVAKGDAEAMACVGGPLYALDEVRKGDTIQLRFESTRKRLPKPVTVCVMDGETCLLAADVGNGPMEFQASGRPEYLAVVVREDCKLTIESIEIRRSSAEAAE